MERRSLREGVITLLFYVQEKNKHFSLRTLGIFTAKLILRRSTPVLAEKNSQQRSNVLFLCHNE